jgi:hypothetical protein
MYLSVQRRWHSDLSQGSARCLVASHAQMHPHLVSVVIKQRACVSIILAIDETEI